MNIIYRINAPISADQFIALLRRCSLGARRPIEDHACIEGMLIHANLTVTAWDDDKLVGIARSVTDVHYACYLSDLAVDEDGRVQLSVALSLTAYTTGELRLPDPVVLLRREGSGTPAGEERP